MDNSPSEEAQQLVRQAARALARNGLVTAYGHCSMRLDDSHFLVCAAKSMAQITDSDDGTVVNIHEPLPKGVLGEVRAHQQIYKRRSDVGGVCRIHSPHLYSISAIGRSPLARDGFGAFFAPSAPFSSDMRLLRSDELAAAVAERLGQARAILLRGSGSIIAGRTLPEAVVLSWMFEQAARVELDVLKAGAADYAPVLTEEEATIRSSFDGGVVERKWQYMTAQ